MNDLYFSYIRSWFPSLSWPLYLNLQGGWLIPSSVHLTSAFGALTPYSKCPCPRSSDYLFETLLALKALIPSSRCPCLLSRFPPQRTFYPRGLDSLLEVRAESLYDQRLDNCLPSTWPGFDSRSQMATFLFSWLHKNKWLIQKRKRK